MIRRHRRPVPATSVVVAMLFAAATASGAAAPAPRPAAAPASGLPATANWAVEGEGAFDAYGTSVAVIGDVNGDGFSDFAVGAPRNDPPSPAGGDAGKVSVYFGGPNGPRNGNNASWTGWTGLFGNNFGWSVAGAGDVNGDGFADMIVGAPFAGSGERAHVFLGAGTATGFHLASATPSTGDWKCHGDGSANLGESQFGWSVAGVGDLDGDGFDDVIVGAPNLSRTVPGQQSEGAFYIWKGRVDFGAVALGNTDDGVPANAGASQFGGTAGRQLGYSVAGAGDVNGDGFGDVLVGAPGTNAKAGQVLLFTGGGHGASLIVARDVLNGPAAGALFGASVATAGDINGDGFADVIVGAPGFNGGRGAAYVFLGGGGTPVLTPYATLLGTNPGDSLGLSVHTAGDLNGDGYADLVVGGGSYVANGAYHGTARVYYAHQGGLVAGAPDWTGTGESNGINAEAAYGASVCAAGDVNGDGFGDLVIGSPHFGQSEWGKSYLYYGSASMPVANLPYTAFGGYAGGHFGAAVTATGDFDGDGWPDIVVGEPGATLTAAGEGKLSLFLGGPFGPQTTPSSTFPSGIAGLNFGGAVAYAGDVDGDGISDLIVGAPGYAGGSGLALICYGNGAGSFTGRPRTGFLPSQVGEGFGRAVASAGDVNGDGYADVLVGAPAWDGPLGADQGRVCLYLGRPGGIPAGAAPDLVWRGSTAGEQFGFSVSSAGDFNRDGHSDVVIGAPYTPGGLGGLSPGVGRYALYLGTHTGADSIPLLGGSVGARVPDNFNTGWCVAESGDVNGDGYSDIAVGTPGQGGGTVTIVYGGPNGATGSAGFGSGQAGSRFGECIAPAGDMDADGLSDFLIGAPLYDGDFAVDEGRVFLYRGNTSGIYPAPDWYKDGGQAGAGLGHALSANDLTGDGFPDVVAGAYNYDNGPADVGYVQSFLGNGGGGTYRAILQRNGANNNNVQPLGTSGAAQQFWLAANLRSAAGRTRSRLEWTGDIVFQNLPGLSGGIPLQDTGPAGLFYGSSSVGFGLLDGLSGEWPVAWKARMRSASRFFPTTPWVSPGVNGRRIWDLRTGPNPAAVDESPLPNRLQLSAPSPNPMVDDATLQYALPVGADTRITVLDLQGRAVRTLQRGFQKAGRYVARWDGRDDRGSRSAPGVYFVRVHAGGEDASARIVRVK